MTTRYDFLQMSVPPPEGAICDFCSSPDVRWAFPCRDHAVKTEHMTAVGFRDNGSLAVDRVAIDAFSSGGWAACPPCHALILRGDRDRLARRSAKRMLRNMNLGGALSLAEATAHVRRLQDQFWENREGAPVPAAPNQEDPTQ